MNIALIIIISVFIIMLVVGLSIATFSGNELEDFFNKNFTRIAWLNKTAFELGNIINQQFFNSRLFLLIDDSIQTGAYFPASRKVLMTTKVANSGSISALTVCAHEFGHAYQNYLSPKKLAKNYKFSQIVKVLGFFVMPLLIISTILLLFNQFVIAIVLAVLAVIIFIFALAFKLSVIRIEKEASTFALKLLKEIKAMSNEELIIAKKLLKLALLTYIGDFFRALLFWTFLVPKTKIFS